MGRDFSGVSFSNNPSDFDASSVSESAQLQAHPLPWERQKEEERGLCQFLPAHSRLYSNISRLHISKADRSAFTSVNLDHLG